MHWKQAHRVYPGQRTPHQRQRGTASGRDADAGAVPCLHAEPAGREHPLSGSRQGIFANSIEKGLRQRFEEADPTFAADLNRGILLSFCVQGCFYAFANNSSRMDESKLVELLGAIAKAAQSIEF